MGQWSIKLSVSLDKSLYWKGKAQQITLDSPFGTEEKNLDHAQL